MDFDLVIKKSGQWFIQFGKKKIRWFLKSPKEENLPLFISSFGWSTKFKLFNMRFGHTRKPKNFSKLWRVDNEHVQDNWQRLTRQAYAQGQPPRRLDK